MSLVGTRPPTVEEVAQYEEHHRTRLAIKLIARLNILTKVLLDIYSLEEYWNRDTIIDYVEHLYSNRTIELQMKKY